MNIRKLFIPLAAIAAIVGCKKAEPAYMTLSDKSLTVEAVETSAEFSVSANTYYRVNNDITWATLETKEVVGDKTTFVLTFDQNTSYDARTGTIRFIGDNVTPLKFYFTQEGAIPEGVYPDKFEVNFLNTEVTTTVLGTIRGEKLAWSFGKDSSHPEFVAVPASGKGEADVKITFPENNSENDITAVLPVKIGEKNYTLTIVQGGRKFTDLSTSGASNTYMINKAGLYKFNATIKGNGVVPTSQSGMSSTITPIKAKVLWCTYNTAIAPEDVESLITVMDCVGGYVFFRSTDLSKLVPGNAVIAATDAADNILWTWQIWQTEETSIIEATAAKWMDRNLGAVVANLHNDPLSSGLMYQWGRKDPFRCCPAMEGIKYIGTAGAEWPEPANVSAANGTIAYLTAHPMDFPKASANGDNKNDWFYPYNDPVHDDLWSAPGKTMFDPCPLGYRVPTAAEAADIATTFSLSKADIKTAECGCGNDKWWYTYAGGLSYDSGIPTNVGLYCYTHASGVSSANGMGTRGHQTSINFGGAAMGKAWATPIRCVKE